MQTPNRPRGPGLAYTVLSIVIIVLVATLALSSRTPPPPTIAEFAPQAVEQITDSPSDQTSSTGAGPGECPAGQTCGEGEDGGGEVVVLTSPVNVPRVRRCIGDPPRQIEDPQSPPCVPYWEGDNGGSTWKGVDRDSIKIAVANNGALPDGLIDVVTDFFNKRFEFYGRQLVSTLYEPSDGSPAGQHSDAVTVDEQVHAFAAADYGIDLASGDRSVYYDRLAALKISSFNWMANYTREGEVAKRVPYQWQHYPDLPTEQRHLAALACRGLSGHPAAFGGPGVLGSPRRFGIIGEQAGNGGVAYPDTSPLVAGLRGCGASLGPVLQSDSFDTVGARNAIVQMQADNVTTVVCICDRGDVGTLFMSGANTQAYYPEWLVTDYIDMNNDYFVTTLWPSGQAVHAYGITFYNRFNGTSEMPWQWATREIDPTYGGAEDWTHRYYVVYLQLASAIQLAGPNLTPETMRHGMVRATFPNPGAGGPPYYQATIKYASGDPWAQSDGSLIWWNAAAPSNTWPGTGTFCNANLGRRYTLATWPSTDLGLFTGACR